ncbi:MAG: NAD(P)-dependent dehydrogenase (short-subunit alcohol dehydrogenase family) [Natrialbaceae archaeon]|jgi:NAD(P)-dependent dehydrogenase (short-subunit alcohol dehydrogenase family)
MTIDAPCRTVLITGSGSGIGAATVRRFLDTNWTVWATDVDEEALNRLPQDCYQVPLDVTDPDRIDTVVEQVLDRNGRLDCLVNNAGFAVPGTVEDVSRAAARQVFDVVVHGARDMIQATLPHLRQVGGSIVNVSSVLGRTAFPGLGAYCSAKFALGGLTDALRQEVGDAVDVVAVEPAWVDTDFARTAREQLGRVDKTPAYCDVYSLYGEGSVLKGGRLAVPPDRVARTIMTAATATDPPARYHVGWVAKVIAATAWLPDSIQDWSRRTFAPLIAKYL